MPIPNLYSSGKPINGILDFKFNQRLDWFINSVYYTAKVPLHFMFFNDASNLSLEEITNDPSYIRFDPDSYSKGDKVVLFYANESHLNRPLTEIDDEASKVKSTINYFGIPLKDIIMIANVYEHDKTFTDIGLKIGLHQNQIILIDYYELQTFFFHKVLGCQHNKKFNRAAQKDIRFLFGKTYKTVRLVAMYQLWKNGLLNNSVTGCLIEEEDIMQLSKSVCDEFDQLYSNSIELDEISSMLKMYMGSPDSVSYIYFKTSDGLASNHCPSYPYDYNILFTNSKVSVIPETYFYGSTVFITEKTYKAIYNHHPFTVLSTPNFLKTLRDRGYKTFQSVCDESYDICRNNSKRIDLVINSTKELLHSPKHEQIDSITKHNFAQLEKNCFKTIEQLNNVILNNFS